jgi:hypothetical protein
MSVRGAKLPEEALALEEGELVLQAVVTAFDDGCDLHDPRGAV